MSIEDMIQTIETLDDKNLGTGASSSEIAEASCLLNVEFPTSYRIFLEKYGWARLIYDELYGVGRHVPRHLDLVAVTLAEREKFSPILPRHLIPILPDGSGSHYCLDTSKSSQGECPVVFWDHNANEEQVPEVVDRDFGSWIARHVAE